MKCSRVICNNAVVHRHVGAITGNHELCDGCFREWKELNEKVRLCFVAQLERLQGQFIYGRSEKPEMANDADAETIALPFIAEHAPILEEPDPVISVSDEDTDIIFSDS